ncbi:MAG: carboxypeptidase-like regulatory domain-containing protein [Bacteroidales bacterium]|nr:carboxypeptidase-like regulatory domain-containing protein [Bacteroidales bacterium]
MKKFGLFLCLFLSFATLFAQQKQFSAKVLDGITYQPLVGASIYNANTHKFAFSDDNGRFSISVSINDTLVISKSVYRQLVVTVNQNVFNNYDDFFLYYKATMLKEVRIIGLNPSYEGFKNEIVHMDLPDYYKRAEDVKLSDFEKANATYKPDGNLLSLGGKITTSPITYLYDKYSRKSKMNRLYNEMLSYQDDVNNIQDKYNREIVSELTGLQGDELVAFMMYCRFSYYDLVRWDREKIKSQIKAKYYDYQYDSIFNEQNQK